VRAPSGTITTFDAPGAGTGPGQGTDCTAINPEGEIAGIYYDTNDVAHGFVRDRNGRSQRLTSQTRAQAPAKAQSLPPTIQQGRSLDFTLMRTTLTTVSSSRASKRPANDEEGKIVSVRYEAVSAMLLNEFLKDHQKVQDQGATIARQQRQIEALTADIQKVSAQSNSTSEHHKRS